VKKQLQKQIFEIIQSKWPKSEILEDQVEISYPPEGFGDYSCNIAMKLARKLIMNPEEIAENIKEELNSLEMLEKIEVVKPGFLNIFSSADAIKDDLLEIAEKKEKYGSHKTDGEKTVMVEFGQPNTHKAITVGHLRSAISGLAVVKLFEKLGYKVVRANYFGDIGMHVAKSTWGVMHANLPKDFESWDVSRKMELVDQSYVRGAQAFTSNPEAESEIRQINLDIYNKEKNENVEWYQKIRDWSMEYQDEVFAKLGIKYDRQYPESEVFEEATEIVKKYQKDFFQESDGAIIYDGKKEGLTTWVFLTGEGNPTYSAKDLALAVKKFSEFKLDKSIITTSVEQADYFKVIIRILDKIDPAMGKKYKHIPFGWLLAGNKKTSSRMGNSVKCVDVLAEAEELSAKKIAIDKEYDDETKKEIVEKVAMAGIKFLILSHEFHKNINYNPDEFIKLNGFSGPFILYSYVRTQAIIRKVGKPEKLDPGKLADVLNTDEEQGLIKQLGKFPDIVEAAGKEIAPHLICNYVYEVAQKFNTFYEACPIKDAENKKEKHSRLMLVSATGQVLKNGLNLLGIDVLEKM